jgi:hypothetical protein
MRIMVPFTVVVGAVVVLVPTTNAAALLTSSSTQSVLASREGDLIVVDPERPDNVLGAGDSNTPFGLRLPADASCPGDSRNDSWRFQGFIVPASVDLATLELTSAGPVGTNESVLFTHEPPSPIVDELTDANSAPGQPGRIPGLPPLSFATRVAKPLAAGEYRVVIACTLRRKIDRYWDSSWTLTSKPAAEPAQFAWQLTDGSAEASKQALDDGPGLVWPVRIAALLVGTSAIAFLIRRRSRSESSPPSKEHLPS